MPSFWYRCAVLSCFAPVKKKKNHPEKIVNCINQWRVSIFFRMFSGICLLLLCAFRSVCIFVRGKRKTSFVACSYKPRSWKSKRETENLHVFDPFCVVAEGHPVLFEGNLPERQILEFSLKQSETPTFAWYLSALTFGINYNSDKRI